MTKFRFFIFLLTAALILSGLSSCATSENTKTEPVLNLSYSAMSSVSPGTSCSISWNFDGYDTLRIFRFDKDAVQNNLIHETNNRAGTFTVTPHQNTIYNIEVYKNGLACKAITYSIDVTE